MTTPEYRVLAADVQSGKVITELRVSVLSYECALNNLGALTATIPMGGLDQSQAAQQIAGTAPGRVALYVFRDDVIVWAGILWGRRYKTSTRAILLDGRELLSLYVKRETFDYATTAAGIPACDTIRWLVEETQYPNESLFSWANPNFNPAGQAMLTDAFLIEDAKGVYERILSCAVRIDGPDVWTTAELVDGQYLRNVIHLGNDVDRLAAGRTLEQSGLEFLLGEDAGDVEIFEDASTVANRTVAFATIAEGSPTGTRPEAGIQDTQYPILGWPIQTAYYGSRAETSGPLTDAAVRESDQHRFPRTALLAALRSGSRYGVGDYGLGDEASLVVPAAVDPRFPDGLRTQARIAAYTVQWDGRGIEGLVPALEFGDVFL